MGRYGETQNRQIGILGVWALAPAAGMWSNLFGWSSKAKKDAGSLDAKNAFEVFDADKSGALSIEELKHVLTRPGGGAPLTDEEVAAIISEVDQNGAAHYNVHVHVKIAPTLQDLCRLLLPC